MRNQAGLVLALVLALGLPGAAPAEAQTSDCATLLANYARTAEAFPEWRSNSVGINRNTSRAAQRVIQGGCVTRDNDLANLTTLSTQLRGGLRGETGTPIARTWLQAGIVPGFFTEQATRGFFSGLGYGTRSEGAPGLGRWILVGPFSTEGGFREAAEIARRAGFRAPLPRSYP